MNIELRKQATARAHPIDGLDQQPVDTEFVKVNCCRQQLTVWTTTTDEYVLARHAEYHAWKATR